MQIATLTSLPTGPATEAEIWEFGVLIDTGVTGTVSAVNDLGDAVGEKTDAHGSGIGAFLWQSGTLSLLTQLASATALNDADQVAGTVLYSGSGTSALSEATLYQNGQVTLLGFLNASVAGAYSSATGINNNGDVVGSSLTASGVGHAFLWKSGVMTDLGVMTQGDNSVALAVNATDQAVGVERSPDNAHSTAVLWQSGAVSALAQLGNDDYSYASGINDAGLIVGAGQPSGGTSGTEAILWDQGQAISLNSLLPINSGWVLSTADSITNSNEIFGQGSFDGHAVSYELTLGTSGTAEIGISAQMATILGSAITSPITVIDSSENVQYLLDSLAPIAAAGNLAGVDFICIGLPMLSITTAQMSSDASVLAKFSGDFLVTSPGGDLAGFGGTASQYSVTVSAGGVTVTGTDGSDLQLTAPSELRFADQSELVAAAPSTTGGVTSGNVAELYAAVLARAPEIGGVSFYQDYSQHNPSTPLVEFAEWFLSSSEYTSAHSYAATPAGDTQFITDSYQNLLGRTPSSGEINFYLTNVMDKAETGLMPGTQAFASAQFQAHAQMLVYFSVSSEFISDVQVTAQTPASAQHWLVLV
jgi:probable HAF family extracellular repeat protein